MHAFTLDQVFTGTAALRLPLLLRPARR